MTLNNHHKSSVPPLVSQLLEPLFYYDIFSYPLTIEEILQFSKLPVSVERSELDLILMDLVSKGRLFHIEGFFLLRNEPNWVKTRRENNKRAEQYKRRARRMIGLMTWFPYVRAVFISGSLSKNVMPRDGDIDYFIVTKPNRLWVTRTFLILFKKIFLFNSHKYFCVNYFVDEERLEIEEKNRFTATEIATIFPIYGKEIYAEFWKKNRWIAAFYPNVKQQNEADIIAQKRTIAQRLAETLLNLPIGDWLDVYCMKKTLRHWNKKFENMNPEEFEVALKSRRNISKHHPQRFQTKVLKAFEERVQGFEKEHGVELKIFNY